MKRLLILLTLALLVPSFACAGLGDGLKKVLICVPNEVTQTGYMQYALGTLITQAGGTYESINYCSAMNDDSLAALFARAKTSGKYGLVIVICSGTDYIVDASDTHGHGDFKKWVSIDQGGIGIPTLVCGKNLPRASNHGNVYTGAALAANWAYFTVPDSLGDADDSLWAMTSAGDTMLYYPGPTYHHRLDIDQSPENSALYSWTIDIAASRGNAQSKSAIEMWHVAKVSSPEDFVIYYLPGWSTTYNTTYDSPLKAAAAVLKKFNCINYIPVTVDIWDFAYTVAAPLTFAAMYPHVDSFQTWCAARDIPVTYYTDFCKSDPLVKSKMDNLLAIGSCKFVWHPSSNYYSYSGPLIGDSIQTGIFTTWPVNSLDNGLTLSRELKYSWAKLESEGMLAGGQFSTMGFASGNMSGKAGYIRTDTILTALASAGARQFVAEVSAVGALWHSGGSGFRTISYPFDKYPLDLTWTGDTQTVNASWKTLAYFYSGICSAGDTLYANPAVLTPWATTGITFGGYTGASAFYRYGAKFLLGNARPPDQGAAAFTDDAITWQRSLNGEARGFSITADWQLSFWTRKGTVYHNMIWNWTMHYVNNLEAYNNLAGAKVFKFVYLSESPQRINEKM